MFFCCAGGRDARPYDLYMYNNSFFKKSQNFLSKSLDRYSALSYNKSIIPAVCVKLILFLTTIFLRQLPSSIIHLYQAAIPNSLGELFLKRDGNNQRKIKV